MTKTPGLDRFTDVPAPTVDFEAVEPSHETKTPEAVLAALRDGTYRQRERIG